MLNRILIGVFCVSLVAGAYADFPDRASLSETGSVLIYPKVEVRWDADGKLMMDTFITLTNNGNEEIDITAYYVAEQCTSIDLHFTLTERQPAYWSALTGQPGPDGDALSPFTDAGDPVQPGGPGTDLILRGYLVVIATWDSDIDDEPCAVRWNKLFGEATLVDYAAGTSMEYKAYAFAADDGYAEKDTCITTTGELVFDESDYAAFPHQLLLPFYKPGTSPYGGSEAPYFTDSVITDTELTLIIGDMDLRRIPLVDDAPGDAEVAWPWKTKVEFEIWDENENGHTGLDYVIPKFFSETLTNLGGSFVTLPTTAGFARIWAYDDVSDLECYVLDPFDPEGETLLFQCIDTALLGVAVEYVEFDGGAAYATNGGALRGTGVQDDPDDVSIWIDYASGGGGGGDDVTDTGSMTKLNRGGASLRR